MEHKISRILFFFKYFGPYKTKHYLCLSKILKKAKK